jgi:hypothetical protein
LTGAGVADQNRSQNVAQREVRPKAASGVRVNRSTEGAHMPAASFGSAQLTAASAAPCVGERAPAVNVLGAFFPSWMLCILVGIVLTFLARWALIAAGIEGSIGPRGVVYPALALAFSLATWVLFFRA